MNNRGMGNPPPFEYSDQAGTLRRQMQLYEQMYGAPPNTAGMGNAAPPPPAPAQGLGRDPSRDLKIIQGKPQVTPGGQYMSYDAKGDMIIGPDGNPVMQNTPHKFPEPAPAPKPWYRKLLP